MNQKTITIISDTIGKIRERGIIKMEWGKCALIMYVLNIMLGKWRTVSLPETEMKLHASQGLNHQTEIRNTQCIKALAYCMKFCAQTNLHLPHR